jgi:hypothetical protein
MENLKQSIGPTTSPRLEGTRNLLDSWKNATRILLFGVLAATGCTSGTLAQKEHTIGKEPQAITSSDVKIPHDTSDIPAVLLTLDEEQFPQVETKQSLLHAIIPTQWSATATASFPQVSYNNSLSGSFESIHPIKPTESVPDESNPTPLEKESDTTLEKNLLSSETGESPEPTPEKIGTFRKNDKKNYTMHDLKVIEDSSGLAGLIALFGSLATAAVVAVGRERIQAKKNQEILEKVLGRAIAS